jgi:hypothetical protein
MIAGSSSSNKVLIIKTVRAPIGINVVHLTLINPSGINSFNHTNVCIISGGSRWHGISDPLGYTTTEVSGQFVETQNGNLPKSRECVTDHYFPASFSNIIGLNINFNI